MVAVRIHRKLDSDTLHLPEVKPLIGKTVEITVTEQISGAAPGASAGQPIPLEPRFRELVGEWKNATRFVSSVHDMVSHPAYLQIIGMGKDALPLLIDELRRAPDHWFAALQAITGSNPIAPSAAGNVQKMTQAWLSWAEKRGL